MHPWLEDLTLFTFHLVFDTEEKCITLFTDMGLIPDKDGPAPNCPSCSHPMSAQDKADSDLEWEWVCGGDEGDSSSEVKCADTVNPAENTLFEGKKLPCQDILVIIYFFVIKQSVNTVVVELSRTNRFFNKPEVSKDVVCEYFSIFREVCEVHLSHNTHLLGGPGKTARISDMFLTKRKYHYDRVFGQNPLLVLGLYSRLEQEGVFLEIDERKKVDLLPFIYEYFHPETKLISLGMEQKVVDRENSDEFGKKRKRQRISGGKQPDSADENLLVKHLEQCVPIKPQDFQQYMGVVLYRRWRFSEKNVCEQLETFLFDIRSVYPGPLTQGLRLKSVNDWMSEQCQDNQPGPSESGDQGEDEPNFDW